MSNEDFLLEPDMIMYIWNLKLKGDTKLKCNMQKSSVEEFKSMGKPHSNPLLDHRQYKVEYIDGQTKISTANAIVRNMISPPR